jgi:hypothetical protein
MPEKGDFNHAVARLEQRPTTPPAAGSARGKGRPPGKRSDPEYQPTTVLLRQQTKKMANRLLEDGSTGQDLSELIEQLLSEWIQEQSKILMFSPP